MNLNQRFENQKKNLKGSHILRFTTLLYLLPYRDAPACNPRIRTKFCVSNVWVIACFLKFPSPLYHTLTRNLSIQQGNIKDSPFANVLILKIKTNFFLLTTIARWTLYSYWPLGCLNNSRHYLFHSSQPMLPLFLDHSHKGGTRSFEPFVLIFKIKIKTLGDGQWEEKDPCFVVYTTPLLLLVYTSLAVGWLRPRQKEKGQMMKCYGHRWCYGHQGKRQG